MRDRRRAIFITILIGILIFIINVGILIAEDVMEENPIQWTLYIINEGTGALVGLMLVPFLFYFFHHFPLDTKRLSPNAPFYLLASLVYGVVFTSLMYSFRVPLYQYAGFSIRNSFNHLPYRYLMEYFKQFSFFWLIYIVYRFIMEHYKRKEETLKAAELEQLLVKAELEALKMRLNPHFFFNTLNTISSLIYDDPKKADQLITHLGNFFRKVLNTDTRSFHSIKDEIALTKQYVEIMKGRFEEKLVVDFNIAPEVAEHPIPILLFQPLVENAIQYSMGQYNHCHATVAIEKTADRLICVVEDKGPGISAERLANPFGIGLNTVISRLERLYHHQHQFSFSNQATGGLRIEIQFPIND